VATGKGCVLCACCTYEGEGQTVSWNLASVSPLDSLIFPVLSVQIWSGTSTQHSAIALPTRAQLLLANQNAIGQLGSSVS